MRILTVQRRNILSYGTNPYLLFMFFFLLKEFSFTVFFALSLIRNRLLPLSACSINPLASIRNDFHFVGWFRSINRTRILYDVYTIHIFCTYIQYTNTCFVGIIEKTEMYIWRFVHVGLCGFVCACVYVCL